MPARERVPPLSRTSPEALELLRTGELEVVGRLVDASNATLLCSVSEGSAEARCVYKPVAGERPLWDFPDGTLAGREAAAFLVSEAFGGSIIPPTLVREGPFGPGMVQLWIDIDPAISLVDVTTPDSMPDGWLHVLDALGPGGQAVVLTHADDPRLRRMAVLDVVLNNADRKGGHVLPTPAGQVHGVDHGVCFHVEHKLRTVLWGWAGSPLTEEECAALTALREEFDGALGEALATHLTPREVTMTARRVDRLLSTGRLPQPQDDWPTIPWPPF